jgi:H+-transporting ATPase
VGDWADFGIIITLLVVNALVGFWEEHQAGNAIEALRSQLALLARVKRDGQWGTIPARDLVPGDLLHLRSGDIIPADALQVGAEAIEVDQSALTGESLPVAKRAQSILDSALLLESPPHHSGQLSESRQATILITAVLVTQVAATLLAVYGVVMTPLVGLAH